MAKNKDDIVELLDENLEISMAELCKSCTVQAETIMEMVEEGLIEPLNETNEPLVVHWRFQGPAIRRVKLALRLQQDLRVNLAGASLAIELIEEIERLKQRLLVFNDDKL